MNQQHTPVLIVGGGLTGVAAAVFLSQHGIDSVLVDRRSGTSDHPKARAINPRTTEVLRSVGLEPTVTANRSPIANNTDLVHVITLAGQERVRLPRPPMSTIGKLSPSGWSLIDQNRLEPLLAEHALASKRAELRYNTELIELEQDELGAVATLRDRLSGETYQLRSDYVIAADGSRSPTRKLLGIGHSGPGTLTSMVSFAFRADLSQALRGRKIIAAYVHNDELRGTLMPLDNRQRWVFNVSYEPDLGQRPEDFDEQWCVRKVRQGVGIADLPVEIETTEMVPWEIAARVADRLRVGRVLIAGDAAHVMPPTGAFGASSGIQDAHNLAWKLALVLHGVADEHLLDSYHQERHPVAELMVRQSMLRFQIREGSPMEAVADEMLDELQMSFGYCYGAGAFAFRGPHRQQVWIDDPHNPSALPASRAPHVVLERAGAQLSTLDLFGPGFVLMVGEDSAGWLPDAARAAEQLGIELDGYRIGPEGDLHDPEGRWARTYRLERGGAVLVRPDGYVGWRSESSVPDEDLRAVLRQVIGADPESVADPALAGAGAGEERVR